MMATLAEPVSHSRESAYFWRFWSAFTLSRFGTAITSLALPLTAVTILHANALQLGMIAAASNVAWLVFGLPAGVLTQRFPLRRTQCCMDLTRAVAIASIPLAGAVHHITVPQLVAVGLVVSFADVVFEVANSTFLPQVVSEAELQQRNSLMSGTDATSMLGGPTIGGLVVASVGSVFAFCLDSLSYLGSALILRSLPERNVSSPDEWPPMRNMIVEGWRFVTSHPIMAPTMWCATVVNFVAGAHLALLPLYLTTSLRVPVALIGALLAFDGAGLLVGAALTTSLAKRAGSARLTIASVVIAAVGAVLIPCGSGWTRYGFFVVGLLSFSFGSVMISITARTYRQIASPPELLSRVMATVRFVSWGALPIGGLVGGLVAKSYGASRALSALGIVAFGAPLLVGVSHIRRLRDLEQFR